MILTQREVSTNMNVGVPLYLCKIEHNNGTFETVVCEHPEALQPTLDERNIKGFVVLGKMDYHGNGVYSSSALRNL